MGRHLAIGDIHGCFRSLQTLINFVGVKSDDILITLGDHVNRGPDTASVLDWLIDFHQTGQLVALRGNHEVMMLNARHSKSARTRWLDSGGDRTLRSYAGADTERLRLEDVTASHWQFLEELQPYFETDTHFFVHANVDPDVDLSDQAESVLFWKSFGDPKPHRSGRTMICGHSSQKSGLPLDRGHAVCIDTWACGRGWLTCLDVATGQLWQANESRETRRLQLADCDACDTREQLIPRRDVH